MEAHRSLANPTRRSKARHHALDHALDLAQFYDSVPCNAAQPCAEFVRFTQMPKFFPCTEEGRNSATQTRCIYREPRNDGRTATRFGSKPRGLGLGSTPQPGPPANGAGRAAAKHRRDIPDARRSARPAASYASPKHAPFKGKGWGTAHQT